MESLRFITKLFLEILQLVLCVVGVCSCNPNAATTECAIKHDTIYINKFRTDTIILRDTIIREVEGWHEVSYIMEPNMYDSAKSREILDKFLWCKKIDNYKVGETIELETRTDLEYLPYYLLYCSGTDVKLPFGKPAELFMSLCTEAIDDKNLFKLGKRVINDLNKKRGTSYWPIEYPDSFTKGGMFTYRIFRWFEPTAIDTLRVRVVAHNDREALEKLEKYYLDKGDDKGIAIYYKVMLGYEGNGDLAEKFYRVLEPYFDETPEFRGAVREVLLRAAICDGNARAQELCDSLGFSICDYRLPIPDGTY